MISSQKSRFLYLRSLADWSILKWMRIKKIRDTFAAPLKKPWLSSQVTLRELLQQTHAYSNKFAGAPGDLVGDINHTIPVTSCT